MENISITLPPELKKKMDKHIASQATISGIDRSEYIRKLIIADLKSENKI